MIPGWCKECRETPPAFELGAAVRVEHDPPTSKEEDTLRWLLSKSLPLARPGEANCVVVARTSLGHDRVFPDMLIPVRCVAIEYDSPGPDGEAHGPDSYDTEKDAALRAVGWEVIRVRVRLPLLGPYDVAATGPTHKAAAGVVTSVQPDPCGPRSEVDAGMSWPASPRSVTVICVTTKTLQTTGQARCHRSTPDTCVTRPRY